eukprot:TRINITY_DN404_c0_g1_i3.p1 TRINITY_DN404_c0_g1~~TRINITY_DN404_c0_g1_i3.p1  ORF type:complete len:312 (-),score=74.66 TRINITY_DN404_c0_g1_i3:46-939(-)
MGQTLSSFSGPNLPAAIPADGWDSPQADTHRQAMCDSLRTRGYAIISLPAQTQEALAATRVHIHEFMSRTPFEEKLALRLPPRNDPLLPIRPNRGYISGKVKEFLKIRAYPSDDGLYPPNHPELKSSFSSALGAMRKHTQDAFFEVSKCSERSDTFLGTIRDFADEGSSLSVIRYYKFDQQRREMENPKEYEETADEKVVQDTASHLALQEHRDTGLFTFIEVGRTPGLEVWDPVLNRWIMAEREIAPGHAVLIMGRKMELFMPEYKATLHRVTIDKEVERYSLLYFMDLPSGPNNN